MAGRRGPSWVPNPTPPRAITARGAGTLSPPSGVGAQGPRLRKPQENRLRPGQQLPQERRHLPELRLLHLRRGPHECSACLHAPDR